MARTQAQLRSELLRTDGGFDISHVQVNDDEDDDGSEGQQQQQQQQQQQVEPVPMGYGYRPEMAQVGQGKLPGLPPGVPGMPHAAPGNGMGSFSSRNNSQQAINARPNTTMRKPYRSGMPSNGPPPANGPQPQRRAYSLGNVWKQMPKISHKNKGSAGDEDDEVLLQESGEDVTFNDIRNMGKTDLYGFDTDTSPIIPTIITKSHSNMNNTEYRKAMTAQRKHAMNTMSRQRQTTHFNATARMGPDPRSMSLQGYGRGSPFNPMSPNGFPNNPPTNGPDPRSMSLQGYGRGSPFSPMSPNGIPNNQPMNGPDPRSMSLQGYGRGSPFNPMTPNGFPSSQPANGNVSMFPGNAMMPPNGPRSMSMMSMQANRPPMGYMRQRQQSMLAARGNEASLAGPPRNLKLASNPPALKTLDPGPVTPDVDQPNNKLAKSPLKNELGTSSSSSPPLKGGQLNVLQLSQPQQNELKERENQLAERAKELEEKEALINKREAEVNEELKQKEQELEHERLRRDQEEVQRQEQREQIEPLEEHPPKSVFSRISLQKGLLHPQDLNSINTEDGLDLKPSSTLERGLDTMSLNEKPELELTTEGEKERNKNNYNDSNRDSVPYLRTLPHNNRVSTSTFMSASSDSPQKKTNPATGLYRLQNSEFFTAEEFLGSNENVPNTGATAVSSSDPRSSRRIYGGNKGDHNRGGSNKKILSKISSASSKENESNSGGAPDSFSRNSVSNVSVGSLPSSNDDTFDFKHGENDPSLVEASSKNPPTIKQRVSTSIDGEIEAFSFDNTVRQLYEPMFAHGSELAPPKGKFRTIVISTEQLNMLKENKSLLSEISAVSAELADSIRRECALEEKLRAASAGRGTTKDVCNNSLLEYEQQLRSKSGKIVELLKKLNEQRLKRLIAEEQLLLSENGVKPSSIELVHKILNLESQLEAKNHEIEQLKENSNHPL